MRRRLEAEATSDQGIKDELRPDAAFDHRCDTRLSIADIGRLLGDQEPSAFHCTFKMWSSVQPGQYRAKQAAPSRASSGAEHPPGPPS